MRIWIAAGLGLLLAGCAEGVDGNGPGWNDTSSKKLPISSAMWAKYQDLKGKLTPNSDFYFAAASSGGYAWETDQRLALQECQLHAGADRCVLFAHNGKVLVPYQVK